MRVAAAPVTTFVMLDDDNDARVILGTDFAASPQIRRKVLSDGSVVLDVTPACDWPTTQILPR